MAQPTLDALKINRQVASQRLEAARKAMSEVDDDTDEDTAYELMTEEEAASVVYHEALADEEEAIRSLVGEVV